jgi:hypothetical protein
MDEWLFVPEGQADRSQARSAWESVPRKNRPVGHGMIGRRYPTGISRRNVRRVSLGRLNTLTSQGLRHSKYLRTVVTG